MATDPAAATIIEYGGERASAAVDERIAEIQKTMKEDPDRYWGPRGKPLRDELSKLTDINAKLVAQG